jgi:hypothetical protein
MQGLWWIALLAAVPALAQIETDTISITAVHQVALQPDQIAFYVTATSGPERNLDDVLAALGGTGIAAANLQNLQSDSEGRLQWGFSLAVPFSKVASTVTTLIGIKDGVRGVLHDVSFLIQGTQVSDAARQAQLCKQSDLIFDATAQARKVADAGGYSVGPILSLTDGAGQTAGAPVAVVQVFTAVFGIAFLSYSPPPPPLTCAATVKFRLLRFH